MGDAPAYLVEREVATSPVLLVCEHASNHIPAGYDGLGLEPGRAAGHIAWDPGALSVARAMSAALDATLVAGVVSRLLYDLNRPPEAPSAMITESEGHPVPGNQGLSAAARAARVETIYRPFHDQLAALLAARQDPVLVTVHSFTPVFHGRRRRVEYGILHDRDTRLADAMLARPVAGEVARNAPYGPEDGVTHTLVKHALPQGRLNVMLEIRNDLIATDAAASAIGAEMAAWVAAALADLGVLTREDRCLG